MLSTTTAFGAASLQRGPVTLTTPGLAGATAFGAPGLAASRAASIDWTVFLAVFNVGVITKVPNLNVRRPDRPFEEAIANN